MRHYSGSGYAVLPYIKGLTEPLTRVLRKYDIKVSNNPVRNLQQDFPSPKDRPKIEKQTNVVYKIVKTARRVISVKRESVLKQGKMNIFGT